MKFVLFTIILVFSLSSFCADKPKTPDEIAEKLQEQDNTTLDGDDKRDENPPEGVEYYRISPDILTNLDNKKKVSYVNIRVELMTHGKVNRNLLELHEPLIIDSIILFLNASKKEQMETGAPRNKLKKDMLKVIQKTLKRETGSPIVDKVLLMKVIVE